MTKGNVMIAMSGGVDSSVAAHLLCEQGYACIGVTMKLFENDDIGAESNDVCCSLSSSLDARRVADKIGIPHYTFNFSRDFDERVIGKFVREYELGRTPNPCVDCNRFLKFERLFLTARQAGCDFIATGHYAGVGLDGQSGRYLLKKALDKAKDQSYVLYMLTQEQLARTLFPLGGMRKSEVREVASAYGFANAQKPESQDICFVPDGRYADFIERRTGRKSEPGDFIDESGRAIGRHKGLIRYTIGQRRRLGIARPERFFVRGKNPLDNTVTLCGEESLCSKTLVAEDFNTISCEIPDAPLRVRAMTRYRQRECLATAVWTSQDRVVVTFDEPQRLAAPGQAVVLYETGREDVVLGGGTVSATDDD
ncbi:MAG: tRNA 2-thiouridine(34) synthase MnmA [Synergistaceae bacterium]|nr:tRNA 2-thiouridine(34) synthase MnmA [Synergistaceae bacterium]